MKCRICGINKAEKHELVQSPYYDLKYTLYCCEECNSYFFLPNEHDVDLNELYNEEQRIWKAEFKLSKYWFEQVKIIQRYTTLKQGLDILDIGCRTGDFLLHWSNDHSKFGVEVCIGNAEVARNRGISVYSDFVENVSVSQKFDVITCYALLEHVYEPQEVLKKIISLLKPGAVLAIMIPSIETHLVKRLKQKNIYWHMYSPPGHLNFYSRSFLDGFMNDNGLKLVRRYYTSGGMDNRYKDSQIRQDNYEYIRQFYDGSMNLRRRTIVNSVITKFQNHIMHNFPIYDHMYSYYKFL
jgi:SAM-dependent methyltransferase